MKEKTNLKIGKIIDFDGFAGTIQTENDSYIFNVNDCDKIYTEGTVVGFYENKKLIDDEVYKIAKFVKKLTKK